MERVRGERDLLIHVLEKEAEEIEVYEEWSEGAERYSQEAKTLMIFNFEVKGDYSYMSD